MRKALLGIALTGSFALLGTVISLTETSPPPSKSMVNSSTPQTVALPKTATRATAPDAATSLATAVSGLTTADEDDVSVAVENLGTGAAASYNVSDKYVTASIVKLDILCTLLYQAQLSGHSPSHSEMSLTTTMIENSNNDAAQHLFEDLGGSPAITAANKVFGLTDTAVEENSVDEAGYSWGDTTTTVVDQLQLLRQIFTTSSVLNVSNRSYIKSLMADVESDQRWGVSAAADDASPSGSDYMLKNGWLPRRITNLWEINSVGEVEHDGQQYLVAVLSSGNKTMASGISVVQRLAQAAVNATA